MKTEKKNLLVLLGGYYPSYGAPGIVFEKWLPELQKRFDVVILTVRRVKHGHGRVFFYHGVKVHEVSDWLQDRCVENSGVVRMFWRLIQEIVRIITRMPMFVYNVRKTLSVVERLHAEKRFDAVISVSFPPYTHVVARRLKDHHPDVRWAAYSTDTLFKHALLGSHWWRWQLLGLMRQELDAYRYADAVFLTPEIYAWRDAMFAGTAVKPIEQNYLLTVEERELCKDERRDGVLEVVYAGVFFEKLRNPKWFIGVMRRILESKDANVRFSFYLVTDACKNLLDALRADFPNSVRILPAVQPEEMKRIMGSTDVLLNFSNDADQFSPSKIFDYIATGRPVVNVAYPGRHIAPVLERYPLCRTFVNDGDEEKAASELLDFFRVMRGKRMSAIEVRKMYAEYLPENVLKKLIFCLIEA